MVRVKLTPLTSGAGAPRTFEAVRTNLNLGNSQLTMQFRDGTMCIEVLGAWEVDTQSSQNVPNSLAEAERIHEGRSLVLMN